MRTAATRRACAGALRIRRGIRLEGEQVWLVLTGTRRLRLLRRHQAEQAVDRGRGCTKGKQHDENPNRGRDPRGPRTLSPKCSASGVPAEKPNETRAFRFRLRQKAPATNAAAAEFSAHRRSVGPALPRPEAHVTRQRSDPPTCPEAPCPSRLRHVPSSSRRRCLPRIFPGSARKSAQWTPPVPTGSIST